MFQFSWNSKIHYNVSTHGLYTTIRRCLPSADVSLLLSVYVHGNYAIHPAPNTSVIGCCHRRYTDFTDLDKQNPPNSVTLFTLKNNSSLKRTIADSTKVLQAIQNQVHRYLVPARCATSSVGPVAHSRTFPCQTISYKRNKHEWVGIAQSIKWLVYGLYWGTTVRFPAWARHSPILHSPSRLIWGPLNRLPNGYRGTPSPGFRWPGR